MDNAERKPTLKDVAALSGVSIISASRVMRNAPNISAELREKVERAAKSIGYQRNRIAGSLRGQATDLIAVIVPSMSRAAKILPVVLSSHPGTKMGRLASAAANIQESLGSISYWGTRSPESRMRYRCS